MAYVKKGRKSLPKDKLKDCSITIRLTKGLKIRLQVFSKVSGISTSTILQNALEDYLKKNSTN